MRNLIKVKGVTCLLLCLLLPQAGYSDVTSDSEIRIIANSSVAIEQLSVIQLRKIFSMRQSRWPDGQALKVFVLNSKSQTHQNFCKGHLRMFSYQLEQVWNKLTYSGLGDPPVEVKDMDEMLLRISETPGAIGYLNKSVTTDGVETILLSEG